MNDYQSLIYNGNVNRASLDLKVPGVRGIEPATNGKPVTLTPSGTDQPNGTAVFDTKKLHAVGMVILALVILDMTANSFVDELVILDSKVTQDEADGFDIRELTEIPPLATLSDATWVKAGDSISISFYLELKCGQGSYYVSLNLSDTDGNPLDFLVDATLGQLVGESKTKHSVATKLFKKRNNTTLTATLGFFTSDGVLIKG